MQYRLRLMHNQDEVQGQKVFIANDLTKQNISVSKLYVCFKRIYVCSLCIYDISNRYFMTSRVSFQLHIRVSRYNQFIPMSGVQWVNYMYFHRYTLGTFAVIVITIFYGK